MTLATTASGLDTLLAAHHAGAVDLVAAWTGPDLASWQVSAGIPLPRGSTLDSIVAWPDSSLLVLFSDGSDGLHLERVSGPGAAWTQIPAPPAGTQTVVPSDAGGLSALVVDNSTLTDWELAPGGGAWAEGQVLQVPIEYGSSS
jgi:hypothetical protein